MFLTSCEIQQLNKIQYAQSSSSATVSNTSYAELVSHMSKMSSTADCRGSKLITSDYYWLWGFFMRLAFHGCTSCYFSILFAVITLTSSKSESQSEAV